MNNTIKFLPKYKNLISPIAAKNMLPDWYKNQEGYNHFGHPTIKRCMPIFDAMSSGYILRSPANITVDSTNPAGLIVTADNNFGGELISQHDIHQYDKYPTPSGSHRHLLRIHPMWAVKTPEGYSSLFINPIHGASQNINAVAGMIDTDRFPSDGHLSFFVSDNTVFNIEAGTPLVQVIPILRNSWEMEEMSVTESLEIMRQKHEAGLWVDGQHQTGSYKKIFHVPKSFR